LDYGNEIAILRKDNPSYIKPVTNVCEEAMMVEAVVEAPVLREAHQEI
jgi:hypothetical protein